MMTKGDVISNPGRWLALCVAPYFATQGRGDMRGPPDGAPKCHPGGGGRPSWHHKLYAISFTIKIIHIKLRREHSHAPPPGWHFLVAIWCAPHVATTPRGEIQGYARLPPPPGWRKCSPPVIVSANGGGRALRQTESHEVACLIVTLHLRSCAVVAECLPRLRAEGTPP